MPSQYISKFVFEDAHTDAITSVAFSPDGHFLVSGGEDMKIIIWSILTGKAVHCIFSDSAVMCTTWSPLSDTLYFGTSTGTLVTLTFNEETVTAYGLEAHNQTIQSICVGYDNIASCSCLRLASAADDVVKIWHWSKLAKTWLYDQTLEPPRSNPLAELQPSEATSVQWLDANRLVVAYMYKGIVCWQLNEDEARVVWSIYTPICGLCTVAPDRSVIAMCNVLAGFDLYEIPSGLLRTSVKNSSEEPGIVLPVEFVDSGFYLVHGTSSGKLRLRVASDGHHVQMLRLQDKALVQAISVFRGPLLDVSMIAAGTGDVGCKNYVQIFEAVEV